MVWLKTWGEERTERYLEGLIKNEAVVRKGHTLLTQLLCAGEFKSAVELYAYRVAELKHKGCPIELIYPNPTPGAITPLVVAKRSPHPYAASLLVDYLLSERGQKILAGRGWFSGRRGIRPKYPDLDVEATGVQVLLLRPEDAERFGKKYQELRERFLVRR
jgi:iron(III) transport system substrate-binding protein